MNWDELAKMKQFVEETERLRRLGLLYSGSTATETLRHSAIDDISVTFAAQHAASQRIDAEEHLRQLAGSLNVGATYAAQYPISEHLEAEERLHQLPSGVNFGPMVASLQLAEEASYRQDIGNFFSGGVVASLAAAEDERLQHLMDGAIGAGYLASASRAHMSVLSNTEQLRATTEDRFLLPGIAETERMLDVMRGAFFGSLQDRYGNELPGVQAAMLAMQAPWLDSLHTVRSVRGFAELQAIGGSLVVAPSFGDDFSNALRADLGDWRDPITTWQSADFERADARRGFYVDRGFNTNLTDFPDTAFDESLSIAGIKGDSPILVVAYGELTSLFIDGDEDEALARTNVAHDRLQRLESQLRKFIDLSMTKAYGTDWPKHRMPNGVYEKWIFKKAADKGRKIEWPLIFYADFTEYVDIICRSDNWREVFAATFERMESVRESFQRMYPIRLAIAHTRPIDKEDELLLFVEAKRLLRVMQPIQ